MATHTETWLTPGRSNWKPHVELDRSELYTTLEIDIPLPFDRSAGLFIYRGR